MDDRQRLVQWMQENGYTNRLLGIKTGDSRHTIYYMTSGERPVNEAFKHRFYAAFGHETFEQVFPTGQPVPAS